MCHNRPYIPPSPGLSSSSFNLFDRDGVLICHHASLCVQGFMTTACQQRNREVCCCCCWGLVAGHRWIHLRGEQRRSSAPGSEESDWFGSAADSWQEQAFPCHTPHNSLINALRPKIAPLQHEIELNHLDTSGNWLKMSKRSGNDINNLGKGKRGKENMYYYDGAASNRTPVRPVGSNRKPVFYCVCAAHNVDYHANGYH